MEGGRRGNERENDRGDGDRGKDTEFDGALVSVYGVTKCDVVRLKTYPSRVYGTLSKIFRNFLQQVCGANVQVCWEKGKGSWTH